MQPAARMSNLPPYPFARLGKRISELKKTGMDIIRLDIGSPDLSPTPEIIRALENSVEKAETHGYPGFTGTPEFRQAVATYYERRFGVRLDPGREVLSLIGSKEGIVNMAMAFVDPGDLVLVPNPGYPANAMGTCMVCGEVYELPLLPERGFLPDLAGIPDSVAERAKLLWLNYPNNPTTATAPMSVLREAVEFAQRHNILLCYDNPYHELVYNGHQEHSILEVSGAMDVAVEFNSLSKTYNMAGWRIGMAVGRGAAIAALAQVKSNIDSGVFQPIQDAAIAALTGDQEWLKERNAIYQKRRDLLLETLPRFGMEGYRSSASLYVWAKIPPDEPSAEEFASRLLEQAGVSIAPGSFFGSQGEGYVRISLGTPTDRLAEALERMEKAVLLKQR